MKRIPNIFIVSLTMMSLFSCREQDKKPADNLVIWEELEEMEYDSDFAPLVASMDFIPLETSDSCLLSDVYKIVQTDSAIYVLAEVSTSSDKELHSFTKSGRHIRKIANKGEGPGEYLGISSFAISGDTLLLFDDVASKIKCYDLDGNYLGITGGFVNPTGVNEISLLQGVDKVLIRANIGNYDSTIYGWQDINSADSLHTIERHPFDCNSSIAALTANGSITDWDESTKLLVMPYSQTLYGLDKHTLALTPLLTITSLETDNAPEPEKGEHLGDYLKRLDSKVLNGSLPISALRNGKWLIVLFRFGSILWDIENKKGYHTMNAIGGEAKLNAYPIPFAMTIDVDDDGEFLSWESADGLIDICDGIKSDARFRPSKEMLDSLTSESNPIIIKYKLKQL